MYGIILFIHILICVLLIIVVLLQQTRGGGIASVFGGGGGTDTLFGGKGATPFFVRLTTGLAIGFFITSLTLVLLSRRTAPKSAIDQGFQETPVPVSPEGQPMLPEEPGGTLPIEPTEGGGP